MLFFTQIHTYNSAHLRTFSLTDAMTMTILVVGMEEVHNVLTNHVTGIKTNNFLYSNKITYAQ